MTCKRCGGSGQVAKLIDHNHWLFVDCECKAIALRYFAMLNELWIDYQDASRERAERKTWSTWFNYILAKTTYESHMAERDRLISKLQ